MTPFDSWYAANVEPNLPKDFPSQLAKAGKAEAAKVWNAALEVVGRTKFTREEFPIPCALPQEILEQIRGLAARVTP